MSVLTSETSHIFSARTMASLQNLSNEDDDEKFDQRFEEAVAKRRQIEAQANVLAKKLFKKEKKKLQLLKEQFNEDLKLIVKEPEPPPKDPEPTKKAFSKEDIQSYVESMFDAGTLALLKSRQLTKTEKNVTKTEKTESPSRGYKDVKKVTSFDKYDSHLSR